MDNSDQKTEVDIYRDTPVRLVGYANEVGEAFRAQLHVRWVYFSYALAVGYVLADTSDKILKSDKEMRKNKDSEQRLRRLTLAGSDALLWQGLASVVIPGFTINRICALSLLALRGRVPPSTAKWLTSAAGLSCVPFIVHPIDTGVTALLDNTTRRWWPAHTKDFEAIP